MPTIFSGSSRYATDFQSVIDRAVAIRSLPLKQKQTQLATLQSQSSELTSIKSSFAAMSAAIVTLESSLGSGSFTSSSSDSDVASAAISGSPLAGKYSIEVVDMGTYTASMSSDHGILGDGIDVVADPAVGSLSDAGSFTLQVGSESHIIIPGGNTLSALAEAINEGTDGDVQATVVNIGSAASPDYRLSLEGTKLGALAIQLTAIDGAHPGQVLMTEQTPGTSASYRVNGQPALAISSDSHVVTVSPGVMVTLNGEGTADIKVGRSTLPASSALTKFANAYNAAQGAIDRNRGQGGGALRGQSMLMTLSGALHQMSQYSGGSAGIDSLTSLGLEFDKEGLLSFDTEAFSEATTGRISQLATFLGSGAEGGFLKLATDTMTTLTGEDTGVLTSMLANVGDQITRDQAAIAEGQDRIDRLRTSLEARISAADAAIATMEQKYSYLSNMFVAMQENSRSYQ